VTCKKTETQAECHGRLKCKADEELEDCQKRLLKCTAGEKLDDCKKRVQSGAGAGAGAGQQQGGAAGQQQNAGGGNQNQNQNQQDRGGDDRGGDDRRGDDRGDERGGGGGGGGGDRYAREDDGGGRRGRRGRGGGDRGDRRGREGGGRSSFVANKTFGLGFEGGEPTGLNGKYFMSDSGALDFGVGWIYRHYYYGDGIHIYADYLFHPVSLASTHSFELPLYIGVGARFWEFDFCDNRVCDFHGSALGIRIPFGIAFDFNNAPLDIFIQLIPVLDFVRDDYYMLYGDHAHFGIDLSAGLRFWFK